MNKRAQFPHRSSPTFRASRLAPKIYSTGLTTRSVNIPAVEKTPRVRLPVNVELFEVGEFKRIQFDGPKRPSFRPPFSGAQVALLLLFLALIGLYFWLRPAPIANRLALPIDRATAIDTLTLPEAAPRSRSKLVHAVGRKESLAQVFSRYGLDSAFVANLNAKVKEVDPKFGVYQPLVPGSRVSIIFDRLGYITSLTVKFVRGDYLSLQPKKLGVVSRHLTHAVPKTGEETVTGKITSSFAADAARLGVSYQDIDSLVDLFSDRIEFRKDFHDGDTFSILFGEPPFRAGEANRLPRPILGATFDLHGSRYTAVRYVGVDGKQRYFDGEGALIGNTFLRFPVQFSRISSTFSEARFHPILKRSRPHNGVDFAAPVGTPVRSVASGKVVLAGYRGPTGNMVRVRHSDRYTTEYFHLSRVQPGITTGKTVAKGEVIGNVGCTGLCTGPHLHFGFFDRGRYADPLRSKLPTDEALGKGLAIDSKYLAQILAKLGIK